MTRLTLQQVHELSRNALLGSGARATQADPVADSIRDAEAEGIRNVGLGYLPVYCEHLLCGKIDGAAQPYFLEGSPAVLRVDAAHGFCHPAFEFALPRFVELAARNGVAALAITRSYSAGVVGWFVQKLAAHGLVSMAFANTSPCIAPWGGNKALFGTNPLAFAAPGPSDGPIVVDMAASATARVNIAGAAARGEAVPATWLVDATGAATTDPNALNAGGTMSPLGGAKGYGLALMIEIMAAGMTGANWSHAASSFGGNEGGPPGVGQLFIALSPAATGGADLQEGLADLTSRITAQPGARVPGYRRHESRRRSTLAGVEVPGDLIAALTAYAAGGRAPA